MKKLETVTNHPVHLVEENGELLLPTALIPFCEFGRNMSVMGVKIEQFSFPLCTSFKAKLYKDQLCYTVDPNEFKHRIDLKGQLSITLAIDYNEDRVYKFSNETLGEVKQKVTDHFDEISHDYHYYRNNR